jgi:hypothetical protein
MERILKCLLAFFILFSTIDLSVISVTDKFCFAIQNKTSISEIIEIEYNLFCSTKNMMTTVCSNIAKDVESLLAPTQINKLFLDIDKTEKKISIDNCFNFVKLVLPVIVSSISYVLKNNLILLFFFGFIFIFILRYLGLLFTFDGIAISKWYKKAYSM